jgi:hypothetical protein
MTHVLPGRRRRGVSLVELMVAMAGVSLVVTSTAMVIHGAMRAHTASRRFFDDERTSVRLARHFRTDAHAATGAQAQARGSIVSFRLPGGRSVEYHRPAGSNRIERREHAVDGTITGPREDFSFRMPFGIAASVSGDSVRLTIGADDGRGGPTAPGTVPPPTSSAEARGKPPAIAIESRLGRDHRFKAPEGGEGAR